MIWEDKKVAQSMSEQGTQLKFNRDISVDTIIEIQ